MPASIKGTAIYLRSVFSATVVAVTVGIASLGAPAAPARAETAITLANTIALSNCSATLVRFPTSVDRDPAMMLTNGHCYEGGFLGAGEVLRNVASSRTGYLLDAGGAAILPAVEADRVLYATMTGTDVALYRLTATFAGLRRQFGATPLTIAKSRPAVGTSIAIPSSYWQKIWNCKIDGFVDVLREDKWTWQDSIRYDVGCDTSHGTSGSPLVDTESGEIVGINNTGNDDGQVCTLNNPCEVAADGMTSAYQGQRYGEQTYWFTTCLTKRHTIALSRPGCLLPKPTS